MVAEDLADPGRGFPTKASQHWIYDGGVLALLRTTSHTVGWLSDRRVPRPLRGPLYRAWAKATGSDLEEVLLPLEEHPTFAAFFVRRLRRRARPFPTDPDVLPSPVDGTLLSAEVVREDLLLQAKGHSYRVQDLLGGAGDGIDLEGGRALTLYLAPRDYHRIHAPEDARLAGILHVDGTRYSVRPSVLARRAVLDRNERVVLTMDGQRGPHFLVLVGALNVGRIRVVGGGAAPASPIAFRRGDELARFEMGSTVVVIWPRGVLEPTVETGRAIRAGTPLGRFSSRV